MSGETKTASPAEEIVKLWQSWMTAGVDVMQQAQAAFAPDARPRDPAAGWREQLEAAVSRAFEAARIPSAAEARQLAEGLERIRAQLDGLRTSLAALDTAVKGQQAMLEAVEATVQQATRAQEEALAAWNRQWEERISGMSQNLEAWHRGWEEILRDGVVASHAARKGLEDLGKSMWDLSQRVIGGPR